MSSIPPSMHIAASVSQAALQQSEAAKGPDRVRSEQERFAQKMRKELRKHLETVEDSYEPTDELIRIEADGRNDRNESDAQPEGDGSSETAGEAAQDPDPAQSPEPARRRLDLEA
ncbi:MAG: hypothetical protein R3236_09005 [Phycisphaeraceae bacterium]|nr:hypothetical protein [Phycisphaeraceae bacterium]